MRLASGDARDHILSHKKRPRTIVSALRGFAAVETSKNLLSRNFWSRSIFDFCNTIRPEPDIPSRSALETQLGHGARSRSAVNVRVRSSSAYDLKSARQILQPANLNVSA